MNNKKMYSEIYIEMGKDFSKASSKITLNHQIVKHEYLKSDVRNVYFEASRNLVFDIDAQNYLAHEMAKVLSDLTPKTAKNVLIVGLGNNKLIADSLGVQTVNKIVPNLCNIVKTDFKLFLLKAGVFGETGIEAAQTVKALVNELNCDLVVAIDTLAAISPVRLGTSFQISNMGLSPGAGINNARKKLSHESLGVPVVVLGVPMVINAQNLCEEIEYENLILSQKDTEMFVKCASRVLSLAINEVYNNLTPQEVADYFA